MFGQISDGAILRARGIVEHDLAAYGHDSVRAGTGRARAFRAMHRWRASRDELR